MITDTSKSLFSRLRSVPINAIKLQDGFWRGKILQNTELTLVSQYEFLEKTGRLDNFRRAAGQINQPYQGQVYDDSDVYKWVEAVAWAAGDAPGGDLQGKLQTTINLIAEVQDHNGYVGTYFSLDQANSRWTDLRDAHELYCAGHLIQAGIALFRSSNQAILLDTAVRLADHICDVFDPGDPNGIHVPGGHPGIELALVELYRQTDERRYLDQAESFLLRRGQGKIGGNSYHLDHVPFLQLKRLEGHAVRAVYLAAGAADIYLENGNKALIDVLEALWEQMTMRSMYITGGIGARASVEAFGNDYELPNRTAYAESCAAIGSFMWNWRMLQATGDARYADLMERIMYNAALVGVSADGRHYFYSNPLADDGKSRRQAWFSCACCPPNLGRWLAGLSGYIFGQDDEGLWIHQIMPGSLSLDLDNGERLELEIVTNYPWEGEITLEFNKPADFTLRMRIPGWCSSPASVRLSGETEIIAAEPGKYLRIDRRWKTGDQLIISLPFEPQLIRSHPAVEPNRGKAALQRGPIIYCFEETDNLDINPEAMYFAPDTLNSSWYTAEMNSGIGVLTLSGRERHIPAESDHNLYQPILPGYPPPFRHSLPVDLKAVPYFTWGNRTPGWMRVWVDYGEKWA